MTILKHLFSPIQIGRMTAKNRLLMSAMSINFGVDGNGYVTDQLTAYLTARARGGVGMMLLGGETLYILEVHPAAYAVIAANEAVMALSFRLRAARSKMAPPKSSSFMVMSKSGMVRSSMRWKRSLTCPRASSTRRLTGNPANSQVSTMMAQNRVMLFEVFGPFAERIDQRVVLTLGVSIIIVAGVALETMKQEKVLTTGMNPSVAIPAAIPSMFCSAMPV